MYGEPWKSPPAHPTPRPSSILILRMQLTAWLKRHEGRPGVAQNSMPEQILDVAVTGSRKAEADAYEVK